MIPSLLQIPSAVSDSKLHSVLPNNGKGDFQFDRSTGATRINRDGLIEEVGYFSSELVQNGNFSELGSELIVNGDFATDSDWTKQTGWTIANGKATCDGTDLAQLYQSNVLTLLKTYKVTFSIVSRTSGGVFIKLGANMLGTTRTEVGTYTEYFLFNSANPSNLTVHLRSSNFVGSIDNVSVKQVDPNNRWTLGTGWEYQDGIAKHTGSTGNLTTSASLTLNKVYKVQFEIVSIADGVCNIYDISSATTYASFSTTGVKSIIITKDSAGALAIRSNSTNATVDNISVVEVQGDRPRLSYDITNGVVEDKPHLLLEPSATNLLTFSNDYTQSTWSGTQGLTLTANNAISPEGIVNATKLEVDGSNSNPALGSNGSITIGQTYTLSIFVKNINFSGFVRLAHYSSSQTGAWFDLDNGVVGTVNSTSATIDKFPNGWYKLTNTFVALQSTNTLLAMLGFSDTDGSVTSTVTGQSVLAYGAQLEQQAFSTSYIPTAGTTITRAAETCNNSKPSVNSTEGVLYAEIQALASDSTDKVITMSDGSTSNRVQVYFNSSNQIVGGLISSGSGQAAITYSTDIKLVSKIAFKFKQNDFALWVNGSEVGTDVVGNPATGLNVIDFDNGAGGANFYGKLKGLAVYNEALSESQLMQLTGVTASSIYNNFVTRTASFTVEALNEVKKVIDNL